MMRLEKDFSEFIALLNAHQVKYLIVGGYAVAFHGFPRYTKDLDVWIEPTDENLQNLLKALDEFGFSSVGLTVADFKDPEMVVQLGYPPNRIDFLTTLLGVDFSTCYARKYRITQDDLDIACISLEDLMANKKKTRRRQDLLDVEKLSEGDKDGNSKSRH